jgi:hypothetical protein
MVAEASPTDTRAALGNFLKFAAGAAEKQTMWRHRVKQIHACAARNLQWAADTMRILHRHTWWWKFLQSTHGLRLGVLDFAAAAAEKTGQSENTAGK